MSSSVNLLFPTEQLPRPGNAGVELHTSWWGYRKKGVAGILGEEQMPYFFNKGKLISLDL